MIFPVVLTFLSRFLSADADALLFEGDNCTVPGTNLSGKCISVYNCDYAKNLLSKKQNPQWCGFAGKTALVCCPKTIPVTGVQVGKKSKEKCFEYFGVKYQFYAIDVGQKALSKEFRHMAAIGYGEDKANIVWLCGGTLISKKFVLTAAHCIFSSEYGFAKWVRLGDLDLQNTTEDANPIDLAINQTFIHPSYKSPSHYHDIALLKLEQTINFAFYYKPACLHTKKNLTPDLEATGWGKLGLFGDSSSHLMKVNLTVVDYGTCSRKYSDVSKKRLANGIMDNFQMCAGSAIGGDTCPGDSGGPLHYRVGRTEDMVAHFVVAGITSFGKGCGGENSVGVYTRVSAYIGWIESIVWSGTEDDFSKT